MTSYPAQMTGVTSQSHMIGSLDGFGALGEPRILNDHYDIERYVSRRAMFLGNTYRNPRISSFKIARNDAAEVFGSTSQELSVQEIERRERYLEIEPPLPLPTVANTQTLDDFHSFSTEEWTPGTAPPLPYFDVRSPSPEVNSGPGAFRTGIAQQSSLQHPLGSQLPSTFSNLARNPKSFSRIQTRNETARKSANTAMAFNGPQQTMRANRPDMSSSPLQDSSVSSLVAMNSTLTAATSPMSAQEYSGLMQPDTNETQSNSNQNLLERIIGSLGTDEAKRATGFYAWEAANAVAADAPSVNQQDFEDDLIGQEPNITESRPSVAMSRGQLPEGLYSTNVSSLSGRGLKLPVKPQKRGRSETPESAPGTEGDSDSREAVEIDSQPPTKKQKIVAGEDQMVKTKHEPSGRKRKAIEESNKDPKAELNPSAKKPKLTLKLKRLSPPKETTSARSKLQKKTTERSESPAANGAPLKSHTKKPAQASTSTTIAALPRPSRKREPSRKAAAVTGIAASNRDTNVNDLEDIITGDALPTTKAEAKAAAEARIDRLVANYNADQKSRKRRQVKAGEEPPVDFMPEHFYARNFDNGEQTVRCVCGDTTNDQTGMLQCDSCDVWQHHRCVGVEEEKEPEHYRCHVCDPWLHRERIAELRTANVLP